MRLKLTPTSLFLITLPFKNKKVVSGRNKIHGIVHYGGYVAIINTLRATTTKTFSNLIPYQSPFN